MTESTKTGLPWLVLLAWAICMIPHHHYSISSKSVYFFILFFITIVFLLLFIIVSTMGTAWPERVQLGEVPWAGDDCRAIAIDLVVGHVNHVENRGCSGTNYSLSS